MSRPVPTAAPPRRHAALVAGLAAAAYATVLDGRFLWDDLLLVVENPHVKDVRHLPRLFGETLFAASMPTIYYRPLQAASYAVDYRLWGLAPAGFHVTSIVLHAAAAILLWRLGLRLLDAPRAALAAAALFAVHPIHTEAVAYVAGRSDPLAGTALLGALLSFARGQPLAAGAAYLAALLARESAAALVVLFPLVAAWARVRPRPAAWLPIGGALAAWAALRTLAVGDLSTTPANAAVPFVLRLATLPEVVLRYLALLVVPVGLHMERTLAPAPSVVAPRAIAAAVGVTALVAGVVRARVRPLAFGTAWFALALLPVANLRPLATFMAEHWLYVPSMGLFLAAGWAIGRLPARAATAVAAALVVAYGALAARRNLDWRDPARLYQATLRHAPGSARVHANYGQVLQAAGRLAEAEASFREAIRLAPDRPETGTAWNNLGNLYARQGRMPEALDAFRAALRLDPRHPSALSNHALALDALGRTADAEAALEAALRIHPGSAVLHSNLGNVHFRKGDWEKARRAYETALRLNPEFAEAHNNLGSVYVRLGRFDDAEREYRTALALTPGAEAIRRNLEILRRARTGAGR